MGFLLEFRNCGATEGDLLQVRVEHSHDGPRVVGIYPAYVGCLFDKAYRNAGLRCFPERLSQP